MKAEGLSVRPFQFISIITCDIVQSPEEHGKAYIKGIISAEQEENYLKMAASDISVSVHTDFTPNQGNIFYAGMLEELKISDSNGAKLMELSLVPHTKALDCVPRSRSFQDASLTYQQVAQTVTSQYAGAGFVMHIADTALHEFTVQYKETDWQFCRRLASHHNTVLVPNYRSESASFYFGFPVGSASAISIQTSDYQVKKNLSDYIYKSRNAVPLSENDSICIVLKEREIYRLGTRVRFLNREFVVAHIQSTWEGQELVNTYVLATEAGLQVPKYYNEDIIGASIDGNIIGVQGDMVKIALGIDGGQAESTAKWFSYSTVYSSPDGGGWYAMPEIGDEVRLYFPTEKEKHSYVISSVHLPVEGEGGAGASEGNQINLVFMNGGGGQSSASGTGGGGGQAAPQPAQAGAAQGGHNRSNPDEKLIMNKYGKMISLDPTSITIANSDGTTIEIIDGVGVIISSTGDVQITAAENVEIASMDGDVKIIGTQEVAIESDSASILVDDNITYSGAEVEVSESE